jgi:hypothetical protein
MRINLKPEKSAFGWREAARIPKFAVDFPPIAYRLWFVPKRRDDMNWG